MPRKFKIILISFVSLAALAVIALVGVSVYISRNADNYKHYLTEAVEDKTGMKLSLNGPVSVSIFPWIGIKAEDVVVENPERFKAFADNLLTAEKIGVELEVLALLRGNIEVDDVRVESLKLGLVVDKDGVANWLFDGSTGESAEVVPSSPDSQGDSESPAVSVEEPEDSTAWGIGSVIMEKSSISYINAADSLEYRAENIDLKTGNVGLGRDVSIKLVSGIFASEPAFEGNIDLEAEFNFANERSIEVSKLSGKLQSEKGILGKSEASIELSSTLEGSNIDVRQFALDLVGTKITLSGKGNLDNLTFSGPLNIQSKPQRLLELAGVSLGGDSTLQDFALSAQFSSSKSHETRISNISAKLDDINLTGDLLVNTGGHQKISGKLALDSVALDGYLSAAAEGKQENSSGAGSDQAEATSGNGPETGKYSPPTLGLDVDISIGALSVEGMSFQNIKTKLTGNDSIYSLDPLGFDFAASKFSASASANMKQATPSYKASLNGTGVNIEEVLNALSGKAQVSGKADLKLNVTASGSGDAIMKSLGGTGSISAQGNINSLKLPQINLTAAPGVNPVDTVTARLNRFSATFNGSNGVFSNNDMIFDTSAGGGRGNGTVDMGSNSLNYLVTVETSTINLPIRISGPFSNLSYSLDAEAMLTDPANLQHGAEKVIEKHGKNLEEGIQKGLGKLFGN